MWGIATCPIKTARVEHRAIEFFVIRGATDDLSPRTRGVALPREDCGRQAAGSRQHGMAKSSSEVLEENLSCTDTITSRLSLVARLLHARTLLTDLADSLIRN